MKMIGQKRGRSHWNIKANNPEGLRTQISLDSTDLLNEDEFTASFEKSKIDVSEVSSAARAIFVLFYFSFASNL
jgi:hypothetical protein